ncbi:MAG: WYL domain-containing protein, partial [Deltaproteobacteria bacterium]|nr:WYL domain-containing protein [Deltaproteobacteria bacterium]
EQARYIKERQWAKEQKIKEQKDGSIILEIKTSGFWDVKKWVLSFGAEARVLKPEKLRKAVIEEMKAGLAGYS